MRWDTETKTRGWVQNAVPRFRMWSNAGLVGTVLDHGLHKAGDTFIGWVSINRTAQTNCNVGPVVRGWSAITFVLRQTETRLETVMLSMFSLRTTVVKTELWPEDLVNEYMWPLWWTFQEYSLWHFLAMSTNCALFQTRDLCIQMQMAPAVYRKVTIMVAPREVARSG
jgi:hypothetical protein